MNKSQIGISFPFSCVQPSVLKKALAKKKAWDNFCQFLFCLQLHPALPEYLVTVDTSGLAFANCSGYHFIVRPPIQGPLGKTGNKTH